MREHAADGDDEPREVEPKRLGAALARGGGVMRRAGIDACGIGDRALQARLDSEEFVRVRHAVYRSASVVGSPEVDLRIALASFGPSYCGAHLTAAFHHGLLRFPPEDVHIARREMWGVKHEHRHVVVHRFGDLTEDDIVLILGVRMTTVDRTLLDLAATANDAKALRLMKFAVRAALTADSELAPRLERRLRARGPRRGSRILSDAIAEWRVTGPAKSLVEVDFVEFCKEHGLPLPQTNVVVLGAERDVVWFEQQVIGELDTRTHHLNDVAFENDRLRDGDATAEGWSVVRVTPLGMTRHGPRVAGQFRKLLLPGADLRDV